MVDGKISKKEVDEFPIIMESHSRYCIFMCAYIKRKDGGIQKIPIHSLPDEMKEIYKKLLYTEHWWESSKH
jgi:hypothetical protein